LFSIRPSEEVERLVYLATYESVGAENMGGRPGGGGRRLGAGGWGPGAGGRGLGTGGWGPVGPGR